MKIKLLLFYIILVFSKLTLAQNFPVTVVPQAVSPSPIYFSSYADLNASSSPLRVQITLNDITISNLQVRLKIYFEGNGINFQSNDVVIGTNPLFLEGGVAHTLTNTDLAPYFSLQNITGINSNQYAAAIPEGSYRFCFEVYDVFTGNRLSSKSCAATYIFKNEPPFLVLPHKNETIDVKNPQNIMFQWTPRHINVSNVEYELSIVEVWDNYVDPQAAFFSMPPIFQTTTKKTSYLLGPSDPMLLPNKKYAWRVQAKALVGLEEIGLFNNNGYSEVFWFNHSQPCKPPENVKSEVKGTHQANISWDDFTTDIPEYKIRYREKNNSSNNQWFYSRSNTDWVTIWDLRPGTVYEYQVSRRCEIIESDYSPVKTFTTFLADDESGLYSCGLSPEMSVTNKEPLPELLVNDVFKAGDFPIKVLEVSGSNGRFTGKGYVSMPYLKNIKVAVEFTNVLVNTDKQLAEGMVITTYDSEGWENNMLSIDKVIDVADEIQDVFTGGDIIEEYIDFEIANVDKIDGQVVITGTNGEQKIIDFDEGDSYTFTDSKGNEWSINENGNVSQSGTADKSEPATAENTDGIRSGVHDGNLSDPMVSNITQSAISVTFRKTTDTKYYLDKADNAYELANYPKISSDTGGDYYPIHKAVVDDQDDVFYADIDVKDTSINLDSIIIKTAKNKAIAHVREAGTNTFKITVNGNNPYHNEEAIITYYDKTAKKYKIAATFFIHHLKRYEEVNVNVVRVNGAKSISGLETTIDTIFGKAGGKLKISQEFAMTIDPNQWDTQSKSNGFIDYDGSGLMSDYPSELANFHQEFKRQNPNYDPKAYYLFILNDNIKVSKPLSGFMPKTGQWGYLFEAHYNDGLENKDSPAKIAAHELGHGIYTLEHPFGTNIANSGIAPNLLMDYKDGTELGYPDWQVMSDPSLKLFLFQDDKGGESTQIAQIPSDFANKNTKSYTLMTLNGSYITLPDRVKNLLFSTGLDYFDKFLDYPVGALIGFELDSIKYTTSIKRSDFFIKDADHIKEVGFIKADLDFDYEGFISLSDNSKFENEIKSKYEGNVISLIPYSEGYRLTLSKISNLAYTEQSKVNILTDYDKYVRFYIANNIVKQKYYEFENKTFAAQYELQPDRISEVIKGNNWNNKHPILTKYAILNNAQPDVFKSYFPNKDFEKFIEQNDVEALKENYIKLINHFYRSNLNLVQRFIELTDSDSFGEVLYSDLFNVISQLSSEQIEKEIDFDHRKKALIKLLKQENVKYLRRLLNSSEFLGLDAFEDQIIRLIKFMPDNQIDELITYLESYSEGDDEHLWHLMYESLDDAGITFWTNDNKGHFIKTITENYYRSTRYKEESKKFNNAYENLNKDFINHRTFISNYQDIFERTWIQWKVSNPLLANVNSTDFYIKYDTKYLEGTGRINVEKNLTLGFIPSTLEKFPLAPFDLILFRTTSNLGLLSDYKTQDLKPVPAIVLYYDDGVRNSDTKSDIVQTAFDLGTLVIPGAQIAQLSKIGKLVYTLDKISSVTSIASNTLENQNTEASKILGATSVVLGLTDITNIAITKINTKLSKNLQASLNDYNETTSLIENASSETIEALTQSQKEYVKSVMTTEHQALKAEGAVVDELKFKSIVSKIDDVNGVRNTPSLIRQIVSKPSYKPSRIIWSKQNKTTTFIGKWNEMVSGQQNGLQKVFGELSESDLNIYMQSGKFAHPSGFNMLSIDNFTSKQVEYSQKISSSQINTSWTFDEYIWEVYNKPWLESALQRGDDIVIWSDPINSRTGFYKRELDFIQSKAAEFGYDYNTGIVNGTFIK